MSHFAIGRRRVGAVAVVLAALGSLVALVTPRAQAQTEIARTVHNLTPGGPGQLKETRPTGLCVFCHTPHNANPTQALWNKNLPPVTYQLYTSSTLHAVLNQPTGSTRLCLSCHDGILALSTLRVPPKGEALELGRLSGPRHIGTDLSDDHPVSFVYDSALAVQRGELADPAGLPAAVRLDASGQMQCTSCHDPHEDRRPKFLRTDADDGALCLSCHRLGQWSTSSHATSLATWNTLGTRPWPETSPPTVAANACNNCHRTHAAGQGPRLLAWPVEADNCNVCHGGTVARRDVAGEFANGGKPSRHPISNGQWLHDPRESPATMPRHVTCADCHDPHASDASPGAEGIVPGALKSVPGVTAEGSPVREAQQEHEVCGKCHGSTEPSTPGIVRAEPTRIVRLKIDPSNASYHPVAAVGRNTTIAGLRPGYTAASRIGCTDCHNNNEWVAGSLVPKGPHASRYAPILEREYRTDDRMPESYAYYELCYKCHDRDALLSRQPLGFPHASHVVDQQTPCAACHDAHGSRLNAHLINFMLRDMTGATVVAPDATGRLEYVATGPGRGTCYLQCHGADHGPRSYPN